MLFGGSGQWLVILSGGCMEADIGTNARKVLAFGQAKKLMYDGNDEDDLLLGWALGVGDASTCFCRR